ncbi:vacuolar sorting protein SNF8, putative [Perkinsus marinus ATCC 50983]|uniref:Vacuolar sorting protein SNF8, putative n=2 Tax=Perkinsus marinus (strain ATCC 50983 / TXsc) TaxID=423536 RepID=C5L4C3_PERM5|nr:vacuolar sorting protein SNF8, putative [Perkinsus marinus ATCC 50983]EER08360.1 vacuolar sorting protein SNF8, putative [Perkinsus marinus ATCC 50983]|eukprot:XP_002776544.1 vacuolar sorting protein SNF8, putative [Perkinsus marinus ATCC 50983]
MRRGGLGAAGVARRRQENRKMESIGESLETVRLETVKGQCDTFKARLQEFATKYRSKIEKDPIFRSQFLGMCQSVGVDPLQSTKSVFGSMLGLGRFYAELGVQILTLCLTTREDNGGLLDMDDCLAMLRKVRAAKSDTISREDVTKAISELSVLGAGGVSIVWGERGKTFISSVPDAFNADQTAAISLIVSRGGHVSVSE